MSEAMSGFLLLANLSSTVFMTGLIWFVQIVHYPLFASVGAGGFPLYEQKHAHLTSFVVGPPMVMEAVTAMALVFTRSGIVPFRAAAAGLALVVVIWLSTAAFLIPCHTRLQAGFRDETHRRLVNANWIRTVAWTFRSCLMLFLVWRNLRDSPL